MNIKDIAELASVSSATVSRYFNERQSLSQETQGRIQKVIEVTGYNPKRVSNKVDINRNPTIGVLIPSLLNPVFAEIVAGIQQRARHFNYSVIIIDTDYQPERERNAVVDLIRQRVSGVIMTVANPNNCAALELLQEFHLPVSLVHNQTHPETNAYRYPAVFVNNYQAGWDVATQLLAKGHRQLGMIAGQFNRTDRAQKRYEGFRDCINNNPQATLDTVLEIDPTVTNPFTDTNQTAFPSDITAWFCSNDLIALQLTNYLLRHGRLVPEQVSVVGFDGMSIGQITYPPLATVKVPHHQMGIIAVDLLLNSRHHATLSLHSELNYELSLSGTVADVLRTNNTIQSIG